MAENNQLSKEETKRLNRRRGRVILGIIISVLVVVGIVTVMTGSIRVANKLFDDTEERTEFENRVYTMVMLEVLPFDSLQNANQDSLIQACIWNVMFNEDLTKLKTNDYGEYIIPSVDVDRYAAKLFGPEFKLEHHSFTTIDQLVFNYDEATKCYTMPVTGVVENYTPKVVKIKTGRGTKVVTVGYVQPVANSYMGLGTSDETSKEPVKYYDYVFTKLDGEYYLTSIEESETQPTSSMAAQIITSTEEPETDPTKIVESAIEDVVPDSLPPETQTEDTAENSAE